MATEKEILDLMHTNIHALRMIKGYKPSEFELRMNKLIAEHYASGCKECKERVDGHVTSQPASSNNNASDDGFMGKLGKWANGAYNNAKDIE